MGGPGTLCQLRPPNWLLQVTYTFVGYLRDSEASQGATCLNRPICDGSGHLAEYSDSGGCDRHADARIGKQFCGAMRR